MSGFKVLLSLLVLMFAFSAVADESLSLNAVHSSGKAPLEITFNLVASEEILSVSWDFNGDEVEDSTELSPTYVYAAGKHTATATVNTASGSADVSTTVVVDDPFSVSVVAAPSSGIAPLTVKFTASVSEFPDKNTPFMYSWDFNEDGVVDSVEQNPSYTFENVGDVKVSLTVTDAASSFEPQPKVTKQIPITISSYDSKINIASYFPTSLQLKENQVTFLVANEGTEPIKDISAKVIGEGIQHLSSTTISRLKPGEQDSLTVKMNVLKEGSLTASVKIDEKIFPVTFAVAEQVKVNKEELETNLLELKEKLKTEEDKYYEKKADGFLVSEVFDTIKSTKGQLQDAQEKMLTGRLQEAQVNVNLVGSAIADITYRLDDAKKPNQTVLSWMKDNLVTITAIIAAVGTLSAVAVKLSKGAKKLGEDVAGKVAVKLKKDGKAKEAAVSTEIKVEKESILEKDSLPVEEKK